MINKVIKRFSVFTALLWTDQAQSRQPLRFTTTQGLVFLLLIFGTNTMQVTAYSFEQKRTLVTGSSGGIGAGIAKALAQKGARIIIHYNTRHEGALETERAILDQGGICDGVVQCDFRNPKNIPQMFQILDRIWDGGIDILVNNAGIITKLAVEDDDYEGTSFAETLQVNLNAPYLISKLAHDRMKGQKDGGVIINISSIHGFISVEWMTAYAASKAGLDRLTAGLACEWSKDKVRVNAVAPGIVPVERTSSTLATKEAQELWLPHLPVGRMGSVDECAHAVIYLCENEWTTGTILTLDGGMTARSNMPRRPKPTV